MKTLGKVINRWFMPIIFAVAALSAQRSCNNQKIKESCIKNGVSADDCESFMSKGLVEIYIGEGEEYDRR